jgi:hypothetical protein
LESAILYKLIQERLNQKASSIKIYREAKTREDALRAEFQKWAEKYEIYYVDDVFKIIDLSKVEINDNGEIVGMQKAVEDIVERMPGICVKPVVNYTPRYIGGKK